jgi:hypothetical protein
MINDRIPLVEIPVKNLNFPFAETFPIRGYKMPKNFPNDSIFHKSAFDDAQDWFIKFPNCCDRHRELSKEYRIDKSRYEGLPLQILKKLSHTEHFISTRINAPDWFGEITDYIDYIWWNFGNPNIGCSKYNHYLKHFIEGSEKIISNEKRKRLLQYIKDNTTPSSENEASKSDLNTLYDTLQKWINTFPFELPYFKGLKSYYEGKIPAFKEPARFNPYTKLAKAKALTQAELIDALDVTTKRLLGEVQADKIFAKGQIWDISKHRLELVNESLRVSTAKLVGDYSKGELRYVDTLKSWLELQKTYFKEVVEIMGNPTAKPLSKTGLPPKVLALYYIYQQENGTYPHFPHGQKVRETRRIALEHSVDAKNFEMAYNQYNSSKKRLSKVRLPDLEKVIELLKDFPDAQQAAKDELRTLIARNEM